MKNIRVSLYAAGGSLFSLLLFEGMQAFWQLSPHEQLRRLLVMIVTFIGAALFIDRSSEWVTGSRSKDTPTPHIHVHFGRSILIAFMIVVTANFLDEILGEVVDTTITGPLSLFNKFVAPVICTATITSAWIYGARNKPKRAKRYGLVIGAIVDVFFFALIVVDLYFFLKPHQGQATRSEELLAVSSVAVWLMWWLLIPLPISGFLGGLAVDRRWCSKAWSGIAVGLAIAGAVEAVVIVYSLSLEAALAHKGIALRIEPFLASSEIANLGWAVGLLLCKDTDAVFRPTEEKVARPYGLIGEIARGVFASLEMVGFGLILFLTSLLVGKWIQYGVVGPGYATPGTLRSMATPTAAAMSGSNIRSEITSNPTPKATKNSSDAHSFNSRVRLDPTRGHN